MRRCAIRNETSNETIDGGEKLLACRCSVGCSGVVLVFENIFDFITSLLQSDIGYGQSKLCIALKSTKPPKSVSTMRRRVILTKLVYATPGTGSVRFYSRILNQKVTVATISPRNPAKLLIFLLYRPVSYTTPARTTDAK